MGCSHARQLQGYLEAGLTLPQRAALEAHLRQCGQCRTELAALERFERLLGELSPVAPPSTLVSETMLRARRELQPHARPVYAWAAGLTAVVAAAACLLVVAQLGLLQPPPEAAYAPARVAHTEVAPATVPALVLHPVVARPAGRAIAMVPITRRTLREASPKATLASLRLSAKTAVKAQAPPAAETVALAAYREASGHAGGDPDLTVVALENVALAYPETRQAAKALLAAGGLARRRGNLAEADVVYRRVLALPAQSTLSQALAHKALAELRRESVGDDEVARYHYQQAVRALRSETAGREPRPTAQSLVVLADIEKNMGQHQRAAADYAAVANSGALSATASSGSIGDQAMVALAEVL